MAWYLFALLLFYAVRINICVRFNRSIVFCCLTYEFVRHKQSVFLHRCRLEEASSLKKSIKSATQDRYDTSELLPAFPSVHLPEIFYKYSQEFLLGFLSEKSFRNSFRELFKKKSINLFWKFFRGLVELVHGFFQKILQKFL